MKQYFEELQLPNWSSMCCLIFFFFALPDKIDCSVQKYAQQ